MPVLSAGLIFRFNAALNTKNLHFNARIKRGESLTWPRCNVMHGLKPEFWFLVHASLCKEINYRIPSFDIAASETEIQL
ncbi:hypothetical protein BpHYR1_029179 [Brachionus plicatilis]|uniref:Uncharacterized protein n=1 Tax=Brachionus plicatilis TaxID=10195 RepID=A0A3M7T4P1_BRAPC|nr:hypothetical protein BpHYR1_029179 [Brachionus plicatilis]